MEAVKRTTNAGLRFTQVSGGYSYSAYMDGNGDGVRSQDIERGVDLRIGWPERLADRFAGVEFGTLPNLPAVDPASPAPGEDPVKLGSSDIISFTPLGTATPGSLYVRGRRNSQYVIRILGATGRTRILKFNSHSRRWNPL
jgi:hypothetical protein